MKPGQIIEHGGRVFRVLGGDDKIRLGDYVENPRAAKPSLDVDRSFYPGDKTVHHPANVYLREITDPLLVELWREELRARVKHHGMLGVESEPAESSPPASSTKNKRAALKGQKHG